MPDTNKVFQTRIQLKYDTYENWIAANPILKKGEMAIATVDSGVQSMTNLPNIVLKVGDGTSNYNQLKFVSALAADVHGWAKANTKPVYAASEITGLQEAIEQYSDYDTNTQYRIVQVVNEKKEAIPGKYQLQSKELSGDWQNVTDPEGNVTSLIDVTDAFGRIATLETTIEGLTGGAGSIANQIAAAIARLSYTGYDAGVADNSETISFVGEISEANGVVSATKRDLKFKTAYNSEKNKVATEADVKAVVDQFSKSLTYKGMLDVLPTDVSGYKTGDVIIVKTLEYIFDGTKFDQFGDEGIADTVKKSLTSDPQPGATNKTITSIVQTNGMVTATYDEISISGDQVQVPKADGTEGTETLNARLDAIKAGASAEVTALEEKVTANTTAINVLNGDVETVGSVDKKINDKVIGLVSTVSQDAAEANGQLALTVVQNNGTLESVSGSIKANTYDTYGAAAAVLGEVSDTVENKTVYGAFAAAAAAQTSADNAASAITKLTSDGAVATETQTNGKFGVLTQVKQTHGAISKGAEVMLHKVAASGKINDLDQEIGANNKPVWIVFDCGSATEVM